MKKYLVAYAAKNSTQEENHVHGCLDESSCACKKRENLFDKIFPQKEIKKKNCDHNILCSIEGVKRFSIASPNNLRRFKKNKRNDYIDIRAVRS